MKDICHKAAKKIVENAQKQLLHSHGEFKWNEEADKLLQKEGFTACPLEGYNPTSNIKQSLRSLPVIYVEPNGLRAMPNM